MKQISKKTWIIGGIALVVVALVVIFFATRKADTLTTPDLQSQIENSPELKDVVNSPRNNFKPGKLNSVADGSKITWYYGEETGTVEVTDGMLSVLDKGRIEGFTFDFDAKNITSTKTPAKDIVKKFFSGASKGNMTATLVLPNTVDEAFTVSYTIKAGDKSASLASGMFVKTLEDGSIQLTGEINIDPKASLGVENATQTLRLVPEVSFK